MNKFFKFIIFLSILVVSAFFVLAGWQLPRSLTNNEGNGISRFEEIFSDSGSEISVSTSTPVSAPAPISAVVPIANPVIDIDPPAAVKEVSSKSFRELINSSVIQLYCGYFNNEEAAFSNISRGTGVIINAKGEMLTNRHVVYDETAKKIKSDCFVMKTPFPNENSQNPKIYYSVRITNYPAVEKFSDSFSEDKYYNDFAILKINSKIGSESKLNLILGLDYAMSEDYSVIENNGIFNFLPIDWDYRPKDNDNLITLGYGVDSAHVANKITSTVGKLAGNIDIEKSLKPQILLIESNSTAGFSGGALVNPQSKGLIGLISWITSGDETGKYTVAIFRDFLKTQMLQDLNFELK